MQEPKRLKLVAAADTKLGRATIMDRALAQKHGVAYVHLAAFAIDVDRVRALAPDDERVPFAFEVALTEAYLVRRFVPLHPQVFENVLEDAVLSILDLPPAAAEESPFGAQLTFAVFTAMTRGALPSSLAACFRSWRKPPLALVKDTAGWLDDAHVRTLAEHCLSATLTPPLTPPVIEALEALRG